MLRSFSILRRNGAHLIRKEKHLKRKTIVSITLNMQKES
jgi:hypothetical protein